MNDEKELIKINNLNKFGKVKALNNINLSVYEGEWLAIMGPSGSGKSTLLNILSLMDTPSSGEYILDNENLEQMDEEQKSPCVVKNRTCLSTISSYPLS